MKKAMIYIIILTFFSVCLGIALGVALDRLYVRTHMFKMMGKYFSTTTPEQRQSLFIGRIAERLNRQLDLSSEQLERAKDIMGAVRPKIDQARNDFQVKLKEIKQEVVTNISAILDSEQKAKFDTLLNNRPRVSGQK
jgi:Spy/CpxP family protein refolding chaperone